MSVQRTNGFCNSPLAALELVKFWWSKTGRKLGLELARFAGICVSVKDASKNHELVVNTGEGLYAGKLNLAYPLYTGGWQRPQSELCADSAHRNVNSCRDRGSALNAIRAPTADKIIKGRG